MTVPPPTKVVTHEVPQAMPPGVLVTVPVPALLMASVCDGGDAPCCVTVRVWPPMVKVPSRETVLELTATEKLTGPEPKTEAPFVMVIQLALAIAVHVQVERLDAMNAEKPPPAAVAFTL